MGWFHYCLAFFDLLNLKILSFIKVDVLLFQWSLFFVGLCILAMGIAIYLRASFPSVPNDELMLAITARTGLGINVTKTIGETIGFVLAIVLQDPVGLGTIIVLLCLGVFVGLFDQLLHKVGMPRSMYSKGYSQNFLRPCLRYLIYNNNAKKFTNGQIDSPFFGIIDYGLSRRLNLFELFKRCAEISLVMPFAILINN